MRDGREATAVQLRLEGHSIKSIAKELGAAQSSVSIWTRNVKLTPEQKECLRNNMHSPESIEKRRQARLKSEAIKRAIIIDGARTEVGSLSNREIWLIGIALYWGEGAKTRSTVQLSNGDPRIIKLILRFFREVCNVDESKLRGGIHIHEHLDTQAAEEYWHAITGIGKFYKTYNKSNKSSKGTRNSLPFGVCDVYVLDARLFWKIKGWTEGIYESAAKVLE
jgi:hypothetical protein